MSTSLLTPLIILSFFCSPVKGICMTIGNSTFFSDNDLLLSKSVVSSLPPLVYENVGLIGCQKHCYLHASCKSILYDPKKLLCYLYSITKDEAGFPPSSLVYILKNNFDSGMIANLLGQCAGHSCLSPKKCIQLSSGNYFCKPGCVTDDYTLLDDNLNFCVKVFKIYAGQSQAADTCESAGARLVVLNTAKKRDLINLVFPGKGTYRIGLLKNGTNWMWSNKDPEMENVEGSFSSGTIVKTDLGDTFLKSVDLNQLWWFFCEEVYL